MNTTPFNNNQAQGSLTSPTFQGMVQPNEQRSWATIARLGTAGKSSFGSHDNVAFSNNKHTPSGKAPYSRHDTVSFSNKHTPSDKALYSRQGVARSSVQDHAYTRLSATNQGVPRNTTIPLHCKYDKVFNIGRYTQDPNIMFRWVLIANNHPFVDTHRGVEPYWGQGMTFQAYCKSLGIYFYEGTSVSAPEQESPPCNFFLPSGLLDD